LSFFLPQKKRSALLEARLFLSFSVYLVQSIAFVAQIGTDWDVKAAVGML